MTCSIMFIPRPQLAVLPVNVWDTGRPSLRRGYQLTLLTTALSESTICGAHLHLICIANVLEDNLRPPAAVW